VLFGVVCDARVLAKEQRTAAGKLAMHFLPKKPVNKRWRFTTDEYGFRINAEVACEYRDIKSELQRLKEHPSRNFAAIAQRIRELQARFDEIRHHLQPPCPSRYGKDQVYEDYVRLQRLAGKRAAGIELTAEQAAEEAHRRARFDAYAAGPEAAEARRRRKELERADESEFIEFVGRCHAIAATFPASRRVSPSSRQAILRATSRIRIHHEATSPST
jgi:hypothetical protein